MPANEPSAAGVAQLLQYSNAIEGAIRAGGTVSDIWDAVRSAAAGSEGEALSASIFDMNYVAGQIRNVISANDAFANLAPTDAVTGDAWAWAPWSQPATAAELSPVYQIRYGMDVTTDQGDTFTLYRTTRWEGPLEGFTAGDVVDTAQGHGEDVASGALYPGQDTSDKPWLGGTATVDPSSVTILRI